MVRRKPRGASWGGWIEFQVRDAERRGDFDDLPGKGKPIPGLNEPHDDMAWIAAKLRRENADITALLPPALALAKEVEDLPARLDKEKSEAAVRGIVTDLNKRIMAAHRRPQEGPPLRVMPRDIDKLVGEWHDRRQAR